jgi:hypothetical protein
MPPGAKGCEARGGPASISAYQAQSEQRGAKAVGQAQQQHDILGLTAGVEVDLAMEHNMRALKGIRSGVERASAAGGLKVESMAGAASAQPHQYAKPLHQIGASTNDVAGDADSLLQMLLGHLCVAADLRNSDSIGV